jgi:hypothetical protein
MNENSARGSMSVIWRAAGTNAQRKAFMMCIQQRTDRAAVTASTCSVTTCVRTDIEEMAIETAKPGGFVWHGNCLNSHARRCGLRQSFDDRRTSSPRNRTDGIDGKSRECFDEHIGSGRRRITICSHDTNIHRYESSRCASAHIVAG